MVTHAVSLRLVLLVLVVLSGGPTWGQAARTGVEDPESIQPEAIPPGPGVYLGREIAQTMHYSGAEWLVRESREREEGTELMLENLGAAAGMTVCDVGCGNGFYALRLAELVGADGRVIGVDIQPEMLELFEDRADEAGIENVEAVLGTIVDPRLEPGSIDLALLVDVYHEFSHPVQMLAELRESLAPGGRMVLVEFRAEDLAVPIKPLHKMSREQILREMRANGFAPAGEFDGLPWQHMMTFAVDESWRPDLGFRLFDGETLNGWHAVGGGEWTVEDGAIVGRARAADDAHGLLLSDEEFADFCVTFEYCVRAGNSGFYFRAEPVDDAVGVHGFQVEVDDVKPGGLYETGGRGWVVEPTAEEAATWHRPGEWNTVRLVAAGERVEVFVNGHQTASLADREGRRSGRLALQLHGGQDMHVEFRNICMIER